MPLWKVALQNIKEYVKKWIHSKKYTELNKRISHDNCKLNIIYVNICSLFKDVYLGSRSNN